MQDFDLRKYMSNNKLHQSDIGGFSITELQQINLDNLTEADIAYGYSIVKELNLNSEVELLDEGLKDLIKGVKSKLKGLKPTEQLLSVLFAKIKKGLPSGVDFKKFIKGLSKWAKENKGKITDDSLKNYLDNKELNEITFGEKASQTGAWFLTALKTAAIIVSMLTPSIIQDIIDDSDKSINQIEAAAEETGENLDSDKDIPYGEAAKLLKVSDTIQDVVDDAVMDSSDAEAKITFGTGGFEADTDAFGDDISNMLTSDLENTDGVGEDGEGYEIDLEHSGNISNTPGDQDDNPDGPAKKGLDKKRNKTAKDGAENGIKKFLKKYPKAKINLVDGGTNVNDTGEEVEAGSDEAKANQTSKVKVTNKKEIKKTDPTPDTDDTGDTDIKQANTIPPQDIIGFYSEKPDFDSNKYMVIAFQFLPRIIGNGKIVGNPAFERFAKHLTIAKSGETFNDAFIKRRIGGRADKTGGSLVKKAAKAKGKEKKEILDTIDTLRWIRNTKKSPSSLSKGIKALDPNIKLGERGVIKSTIGKKGQKIPATAFKKGEQKPKAGQATRQKGSDNKGKSGLMERLEKLIPTTLQLTEITKAPGFNQDSAKENLGLLTHLFSGIWSGKDDSFVEFDNVYLEDKYKSSVDDFYTKFPSIGEKIKLKVKEKEEEDVTVKTTDADTIDTKDQTKSKTSNVKVGDTVELDPNVSKTTDKSTSKSSGKSYSDTEDDIKTIAKAPGEIIKALSGKEKATAKQDLAKKLDYKKGEDDVDPSSKNFGDELGKQTAIVKALNLINSTEELTNLLVGMMMFINPVLLKSPSKLKATLIRTATTSYDPEGVPDSERVKKEKELKKASKDGEQLKSDLKENLFLFSLFEEAKKRNK